LLSATFAQKVITMAMKNAEKKEWAKLLFTKENLTQKEIAAKVGVSVQTLCKWVKEEGWERLKTSILMTKEEELRRLYEQLSELNKHIKEVGNPVLDPIKTKENGEPVYNYTRYATASQSDTIAKLAAAIRSLETETSLADIISVGRKFINFLRPIDIDKTKEFTSLFDAFIKDSAKKA
jgi:transcriptional regulator with XRE-family HTH domain